MSEEQGGDDKQYEATQKRLDDARKKGQVARSADLTTAAAYAGFIAVAISGGAGALDAAAALLKNILAGAPSMATDIFSGGAQARIGGILGRLVFLFLPWFAVPAAAALAATIAQRAFVVAPDKIKPKLERISPLSNARNKFGRQGLFEFAKSTVKLIVISTILGYFLIGRTHDILLASQLSAGPILVYLLDTALVFLVIVTVFGVVVGGVDFFWQRNEHLRRNRMSRKELMDETKESEGDPHIKGQRRQKGQEIAMNRMLADVPGADVVIVNPTHYAVALKWSRAPGSAPVCVAKGVDEIAARIREAAMQAGVPIHRDPPTARALYSTVEISQEIRPEHYKAVAVAIRFADQMARKRRGGRGAR